MAASGGVSLLAKILRVCGLPGLIPTGAVLQFAAAELGVPPIRAVEGDGQQIYSWRFCVRRTYILLEAFASTCNKMFSTQAVSRIEITHSEQLTSADFI